MMRAPSILIAVVFASVIGCASAQANPEDWIAPGPSIPDVTLTDQDGQAWRLKDLVRERLVLVNFFFTGCSAICPTQTINVGNIRQALALRDLAGAAPLTLSISLDPLSDTPEAMKNYADQLGVKVGRKENWLMLTGEISDMSDVLAAFDESSDAAANHTAMLWIGQMHNVRWTRVTSQAPVEGIVRLAVEPQP